MGEILLRIIEALAPLAIVLLKIGLRARHARQQRTSRRRMQTSRPATSGDSAHPATAPAVRETACPRGHQVCPDIDLNEDDCQACGWSPERRANSPSSVLHLQTTVQTPGNKTNAEIPSNPARISQGASGQQTTQNKPPNPNKDTTEGLN